MDVNQLCEMMDICIVLECYVVRMGVLNMVQWDFVQLQEIFDFYNVLELVVEWVEYNCCFYLVLCVLFNNICLCWLIEEFCFNIDCYIYEMMFLVIGKEGFQSDYFEILEVCKQCDVVKVVMLLEWYIQEIKNNLLVIDWFKWEQVVQQEEVVLC